MHTLGAGAALYCPTYACPSFYRPLACDEQRLRVFHRLRWRFLTTGGSSLRSGGNSVRTGGNSLRLGQYSLRRGKGYFKADNTLSITNRVLSGLDRVLSEAEGVYSDADRVPSAVEGLYSRADRVPSSAARVASEGKNGASTEKTTVFRPQNGPSMVDVLPSDADRTLCLPPNFRRHGDELSVDAEWLAVESHAGALR